MKECTKNFQRYEKKYLMTPEQYKSLCGCLESRMKTDEYGLHTIGNIYLDTSSYQLIRNSIEKPMYKEKLRLRSYGVPGEHDTVFLELKKKFNGMVYKRRIPMTLSEAERYLLHGELPDKKDQIFREIDFAMNRYQPEPKVFICYDRLALFGTEDEELRITFDANIRFREHALSLAKGSWGTPLLDQPMILMEIKTLGAMPLWLSHALNWLEIYPSSFSKYGVCYKTFLIKESKEKGGILSA